MPFPARVVTERSEIRTFRIRQSLHFDEQGRLAPARSHRVARQIFQDVMAHDLWPLLRSISVPARVVFAEDSDVLGRQDAERMVAQLPRGELVCVPHAQHDLQLSQPWLWAEAIAGFLDAHFADDTARDESRGAG